MPDTAPEVPDTPHEVPDTPFEVPDTAAEVPDTPFEVPDTAVEVPDTLAPQEMLIIATLEQAASITTTEVMALLAVKERRARDILNNMTEKGVLQRQGNARSSRYVRNKP